MLRPLVEDLGITHTQQPLDLREAEKDNNGEGEIQRHASLSDSVTLNAVQGLLTCRVLHWRVPVGFPKNIGGPAGGFHVSMKHQTKNLIINRMTY